MRDDAKAEWGHAHVGAMSLIDCPVANDLARSEGAPGQSGFLRGDSGERPERYAHDSREGAHLAVCADARQLSMARVVGVPKEAGRV